MTALVLAGHGSHVSPHTAGLVWSYVDQLRKWGVADEITACFWKEAPALSQALDTVVSDEVVVIPVFTARGYFSTTVIPAEMGLDGSVTHRNNRTIHYTRTLGEHPYASAIVRQRVEEILAAYQLDPRKTTVAVIGHGTPRSPESRDATRQQTDILRKHNLTVEVIDAYLDDSPNIPSIYTRARSSAIIAVPFFLAPGSHVTQDVPEALGIQAGKQPAIVNGRTVYYTPPVGTDDSICRLILALARDTGLRFVINLDGHPWQAFPKYGASELIDAIQQHGTLRFGQLELSLSEVKPAVNNSSAVVIDTPTQLRERVRENPFRPLTTLDDLPGGWCVPIRDPEMLSAVVETVYPGALADWTRHRRGEFAAETLEAVGQRQTGMFRAVHQTSTEIVKQIVHEICGHCVRHATWYYQHSPMDAIPCKAPCNLWLSRVKETAA